MTAGTKPDFDPDKVLRHYSQPNNGGGPFGVTIFPVGTDLGTYVRGTDFDAAVAEIESLRARLSDAKAERDDARGWLATLAGRFRARQERAFDVAGESPTSSQSHSYAQGQADAYADAAGIASNPGTGE
jgi:hypothetical protein